MIEPVCLPTFHLFSRAKASVFAAKAFGTQGRGSVSAAMAVGTQGRGGVLVAKAVGTQGKGSVSLDETQSKGSV